LGSKALSENPRQCALPNAYGTFNRNVTGKLEKLGHGLWATIMGNDYGYRQSVNDWRLSSGTGKQNILLRLRTQL